MATFLLEVGTEELPASFVAGAIAQWQTKIPQSLAAENLNPSAVQVWGTPRRLAVLIEGLPERQADRTEEVKGPPAQAAFKDGQPTPAAIGFARKQGVEVTALAVRPTPKGEFIFVEKTIPGQGVPDLLQGLVLSWITGLEGKRFMRWGNGELRFPRPIRWLVALWGDRVLPVQLETGGEVIQSDRLSQGHRVLHPGPVTVDRAENYQNCLKAASVLVDPLERDRVITAALVAAAQAQGGVTLYPPDLKEEVIHLVEWPTAVVGSFDPAFLAMPSAVTTTVMISHQRYFPIYKANPDRTPSDTLLPHFITISNGDPAKQEGIAAGNGRVIQARLADGKFFYDADCRQPLAAFLPELEKVTFQEKLGSVAAKVRRIGAVADRISQQLQLGTEVQTQVQRAVQLCKADLVSQMVYEFPELQGIMGRKYALVGGEPEAVATAIEEHYLPKGAGDAVPQTTVGQVVALADRLDTLVSIFGLGLLPSGSSDPFALRRAANGVVNIIWGGQLSLDLGQLLGETVGDFCQSFPDQMAQAELEAHLRSFFLQRFQTLLQEEQQIDYDLVNAVVGNGEADPAEADRALSQVLDLADRARFLQSLRRDDRLTPLYETINRATRLAAQGDLAFDCLDPQPWVEPEQFQQPTERAFYEALVRQVPETEAARADRDYERLVTGLLAIAPTVSEFFDGEQSVLVMDPDPAVRQNRLNLLGLLRNHGRVLGDFGAIVKQ